MVEPAKADRKVNMRAVLFFFGIILIALNLRAPLLGIGPVMSRIQAETGLSSGALGLLSSLPLIVFALFSSVVPVIASRFGMERTLIAALGVLTVGVFVRLVPTPAALFIGTALLGFAIATGNVIIPGLIRREFESHVAGMMAVFTTMMVISGTSASAFAVPLADFGGWRFSLGFWGLPALLALIVWLPRARTATRPPAFTDKPRSVWRSALAWQVTLFMGLQSVVFYVLGFWMPTILIDAGMAEVDAGLAAAIMQIAGLAAAPVVPFLIRRLPNQSLIAAGFSALAVIGYVALLLTPLHALPLLAVTGFGTGGAFVLALTFFGLRARDARQTTALSGMAQSVGYLISASGPVLLGIVRDATGGWSVPLLIMIGVCVIQIVVGMLAGRDLKVPA